MAIFHLSVKTISRSAGRSAPAAAAYRAGEVIADERTGLVHDYSRRSGVVSSHITLPEGAPEWAADRSKLWNAAEKSELRKNSTVAREFELAIPSELSPDDRRALVLAFSAELTKQHGVAVDACIHAPGREGDNRNHHAHVLTTTRRVGPDGFGEKARELDAKETGPKLVEQWRARWAELSNAALERAGSAERIDHRSLEAQGVDRVPTIHLGPIATGMERAGQGTDRGDLNRSITTTNAQVVDLELERRKRAELAREKAALEKLEKAPIAEVRRVLQETQTPAKFSDYVLAHKSIRPLVREAHDAASKVVQTKNAAGAAAHEVSKVEHHRNHWREQHPWRAKFYDWGLVKGGPLADYAEKIAAKEAEKKAADERAEQARKLDLDTKAKLEKATTDPKVLAELRKEFERDTARHAQISEVYKRRDAIERDVAKTVDKFQDAAELHARGKLPNVDPRTAADLQRFNEAQRANGEKNAVAQLHNALVADPQKHEATKQSLAPHTKQIDRGADRGR